MKALVIWIAAGLLLVIALVVRSYAQEVHAKLKGKLEAKERRRVQERRELLRKRGWR